MTGVVILEPRPVNDFNEVILKGFGDLIVKQSEEEELIVEAEESVLPYVTTDVHNHRLVIEYRNPLVLDTSRRPIVYHLSVKEILGIDITGAGTLESDHITSSTLRLGVGGSGTIQVDDLQAEKVVVAISGTAQVELTGKAMQEEITVSGSATVQAWGLICQSARVRVSGTAKVTVRAVDTLEVSISGMGTVEYFGAPRITRNITGIGKLVRFGDT
ncbi:MAG: DUF2807 domain-containing protein [Anaerolineaceae bacterium]|nr:DUF2807 domain-containing protein [Anaerolineaceae bacterium]